MTRRITDIVAEGQALGVVGGAAASLAVGTTSEQIDDRVAALLKAGANVTLTYDDVANTLTIASADRTGNVATDAIFDAKGDLPVGTGPDTAVRLPVGTDGQVLTADATTTTGLKWAASSGGGGPTIYDKRGSNNGAMYTTTSTALVALDAVNLSVTVAGLAVGDRVEVGLSYQCYSSSASGYVYQDVLVDQPTLADTYVGSSTGRLGLHYGNGASYTESTQGFFTATEAGDHIFRWVWRTTTGTASMMNGTSGNEVVPHMRVVRWPAAIVGA